MKGVLRRICPIKFIVAMDGRTQESNKIPQGRMVYTNITRTDKCTSGKGKSSTDEQTELHTYNKDQNKKANFLWIFYPLRNLQDELARES